MKSRKMSKALKQNYEKVNVDQTVCPVLLRIFFKCGKRFVSFLIHSAVPNCSCLYLYSHITVQI